jgi:hypothetical protein
MARRTITRRATRPIIVTKPDRRPQLACRAALVFAALGIAIFSAEQFWLSARYAPYLRINGLLARQVPVSADAINRYSADLGNRPPTCRSGLIEAILSVRLQQIEMRRSLAEQRGMDDRWSDAVLALAPIVDHALSCLPTDGRLWQRRAVLTWLLGGPAKAQITDMELSQAYAPADLDVVALRLSHWKRVGPAVTDPAESALRADLRIVLQHAPAPGVPFLLADLPSDIQRLVKEELSGVDVGRQSQLAAAGFSVTGAVADSADDAPDLPGSATPCHPVNGPTEGQRPPAPEGLLNGSKAATGAHTTGISGSCR